MSSVREFFSLRWSSMLIRKSGGIRRSREQLPFADQDTRGRPCAAEGEVHWKIHVDVLLMSALQRLLSDATNRYRREQVLMLSVIHNSGMHTARDQLGYAKQSQPGPTSWLKQQRQNVSRLLHLAICNTHRNRYSAWTYAATMMTEDLSCSLLVMLLILLETYIPDIQDYINGILTNLERTSAVGQ